MFYVCTAEEVMELALIEQKLALMLHKHDADPRGQGKRGVRD